MSGFTITDGVSFSGGFTMTNAPAPAVPENTAAWFGGGAYPTQTLVDRITFATDTATASVRGPLNNSGFDRKYLAAAGTTTDGWFFGGMYMTQMSTVSRITYATDTATASARAPLAIANRGLTAVGNTDYGWLGGGRGPGAPPQATAITSTVNRITWATDTDTASVRGPLSAARYYLAAAGNTTDGWFAGGSNPPGGVYNISTVDRITYATDTATASVRGPLSEASRYLAAAGNTTDGWFGGGTPFPAISTVQRITWATDTDTASVRGPLSFARYASAAAGNTTDGWWSGSYAGTSIVDRITYATDTATASVRGPLSAARGRFAAAAGIQ